MDRPTPPTSTTPQQPAGTGSARRAGRRAPDGSSRPFDAVVVGSGFGGLGAALGLAESGGRVAVWGRLSYAGGCARTFERAEYRFEAAGLGPTCLRPGVYLVGDSVFPGQSTLATALGGAACARAITSGAAFGAPEHSSG